MRHKVAIIMCVYSGDSVEHFEESINSILAQSYQSHDIYLLINGEISKDALELVLQYEHNSHFIAVFSKVNMGLARAMNYLLDNYVVGNGYSYIARMDADDICSIDRLEKQVDFLSNRPDVAIVGSDCIEIDDSGNEIGYKKMEDTDLALKKNIIRRCPFNHPSVMLRADVFESGCRYDPNLNNTQDYYLWIDLISKGYVFANINEALLKFRITDSFYKKRGRRKAINDFNGRIYGMKKLNVVTMKNVLFTLAIFLLRLSPVFISKLAYKFLR